MIYSHEDYPQALINFNSCKHWSVFKSVHLKVSKGKCPICECNLDGTWNRIKNNGGILPITATIDHYRPQIYYSFLRHDHENYLLMCSTCNNDYKKSKFPLHGNVSVRATTKNDIANENPLIANPIHDDIFDLFKLVFLLSPNGRKVLELHPKHTSGYSFEKAQETINLFSLGNCSFHSHPNSSVHSCRIDLLQQHFNNFHEFARAWSKKDKEKLANELKMKSFIKDYGFLEFIKRGNYLDLIP